MTPPEVLAWKAPPSKARFAPPTISWRFREIQAALSFGITIDEFDGSSEHSKAEMLAFLEAKAALEFYQHHSYMPPEEPK